VNSSQQAHQKATVEAVTSVRRWTDTLLTYTTTRPAGYSFRAGQYARLGLGEESDTIWRPYSMTSAPHEDELEFYGIVIEGGAFTAKLRGIKPGDPILVDKQVFGFMTVDRFIDGDDLWLLATGTGVGPYISILRDPLVWTKFRNIVLVHCVRHANELNYQFELEALTPLASSSEPLATLQIIRSTTRDTDATSGESPDRFHGRITTLIENGELEKKAGVALNAESSRVMLCGNPAMIEDARRLLHQRGMRPCRRALPGQFVTENYW